MVISAVEEDGVVATTRTGTFPNKYAQSQDRVGVALEADSHRAARPSFFLFASHALSDKSKTHNETEPRGASANNVWGGTRKP